MRSQPSRELPEAAGPNNGRIGPDRDSNHGIERGRNNSDRNSNHLNISSKEDETDAIEHYRGKSNLSDIELSNSLWEFWER